MKVKRNNTLLPTSLLDYAVKMSLDDADEVRVLLYVLAFDGELEVSDIASALELDEQETASAVSFWRGVGLVDICGRPSRAARITVKQDSPGARGDEDASEKQVTSSEKMSISPDDNTPVEVKSKEDMQPTREASPTDERAIPPSLRDTDTKSYTGEEIARIISTEEMTSLRDYAQNRLQRVFSHSDLETLARLVDHILLTPPMVMLIVDYCVQNGKSSMRYVEKTAISIYDEGITDFESLVAYLERKKERASNEGVVKRALGINDRSLTAKEREFVQKWFEVFGYGEEMISKAFEKTVASTSKLSFPYMSKILESWYSKGFKCVADVESEKNGDGVRGGKGIDLSGFDEAARVSSANTEKTSSTSPYSSLDDFFEN